MIDDDFDNLVRNMFKRFFGKSFDMFPSENGIQMRIGSEDAMTADVSRGRELIVDEIDLGDEYLVIVESPISVDSIMASVKANKLEILVNEVTSKGVEVEIPFDIDIDESSVSHKNGVIEVRLVKTMDDTQTKTEGLLRVI